MTFTERHAQVADDPLVELKRRVQWWASCPGSDGGALKPEAQIVPLATLHSVIAELEAWRDTGQKIAAAKTRGSA